MSGDETPSGTTGSGPIPGKDFVLPQGFADEKTKELVVRAQAGDAEALNELFKRYHQLVLEVARRRIGPRLRQKEEPDDLAQTTFREAARDFGSFEYRGDSSLVQWLMKILQNKIHDKAEYYSATKRDTGRERTLEAPVRSDGEGAPAIDPPSGDLSVTMQVQRVENYAHLREALKELSDEHRAAITLVFFQGLSLRDAGEQLGGKTEDAVRMTLRRAESRLAEILRGSIGKDLGAQ